MFIYFNVLVLHSHRISPLIVLCQSHYTCVVYVCMCIYCLLFPFLCAGGHNNGTGRISMRSLCGIYICCECSLSSSCVAVSFSRFDSWVNVSGNAGLSHSCVLACVCICKCMCVFYQKFVLGGQFSPITVHSSLYSRELFSLISSNNHSMIYKEFLVLS